MQDSPPSFNGAQLRLEDLWNAVQRLGGSRCVSEGRLWATVGRLFHPPPTMTNFSYRIKQLYAEHLLEYERSIDPSCAMLSPLLPFERRRRNNKRSEMESEPEGEPPEATQPQRAWSTPSETVVSRRKARKKSTNSIACDSAFLDEADESLSECEARLSSLEQIVRRTEIRVRDYDASIQRILSRCIDE